MCGLQILTSILASRTQNYIKKCIKPGQTGFIMDRQEKSNIRKILNLQLISQLES